MTDRTRLAAFAAIATLLGSSGLFAVYASTGWIPVVGGMVLVVAVVSELARRVPMPLALGPPLAAAAGALYITAVFAHGAAHFGMFPGQGALRVLHADLDNGWADVRQLAVPVPTHPGLLLITTVGIGLIALTVDLLAATLRRPPLAGLPLLALYAVPAAIVPGGVGWQPFLLATAGFVALLMTDGRDRLGRWGKTLRRMSDDASPASQVSYDTSSVGIVGRRIGVAAVAVGLAVPAFLPTLHPTLIAHTDTGGTGGHGSSVISFNPLIRIGDQLNQSKLTVLFTYTSSDPHPDYLRMTALDTFDGETWSQGPLRASTKARVSRGIPAPSGLSPSVRTTTVTTQIKTTSDFKVHWLPTPYPPRQVKAHGDWRYETATDTVFSSHDDTRNKSYRAVTVQPAVADYPSALAKVQLTKQDQARLARYLQLPQNLPPIVVQTAAQFTLKTKSPYVIALGMQQYFQSNYSYDQRGVGNGDSTSDLVNFLQNKRGFCEQFAATMTLFARIDGIPARVAVGFTPGDRKPDGSYAVTNRDAHAWPELFFPGYGWLRFEPTPRQQEGVAPNPSYGAADVGGNTPLPPGLAPSLVAPGVSGKIGVVVRNEGTTATGPAASKHPTATHHSDSGLPTALIAGASVLAVLLVVPALLRPLIRRRRWRQARSAAQVAHAAWADLRDVARDLGWPWLAADSPRGASARLVRTAGVAEPAAAALRRLALTEERARYARTPDEPDDLLQTLAVAVAGLRAASRPIPRLRARIFPTSSIDRIRQFGAVLIKLADRLDQTIAAAGRVVRRLLPAHAGGS